MNEMVTTKSRIKAEKQISFTRADENNLFWRIQNGEMKMDVIARGEDGIHKFSAIACNPEDEGFTVKLVNERRKCVQTVFVDYELIDTMAQLSLLVAAYADSERDIQIYFSDCANDEDDFVCSVRWGEEGKRVSEFYPMPQAMRRVTRLSLPREDDEPGGERPLYSVARTATVPNNPSSGKKIGVLRDYNKLMTSVRSS